MLKNFKLSPTYTTILHSIDELNEWYADVDKMSVNNKIIAFKSTFYLDNDMEKFWKFDPCSIEYRELILEKFKAITGKQYSIEFEPIQNNYAGNGSRNIETPYPFNSGSNLQISENLMGVASIFKILPNKAFNSKILELGCGWANTSLNLARAGKQVTAVDVDSTCGNVIDYWSPKLNCENNIKFICSSFDSIGEVLKEDAEFDEILFFKSFHHCLDPNSLLSECTRLLKKGGSIAFVAEPVHGNYYVPFGLRYDGTSIFMIKKHGWLELGFDYTFFNEMCNKHGLELTSREALCPIPTMNYLIYQKT
jgi:2-polyprenyl-3-methyl-5-hydroxy-6-metoxy-1,4-benzoquinol methylase